MSFRELLEKEGGRGRRIHDTVIEQREETGEILEFDLENDFGLHWEDVHKYLEENPSAYHAFECAQILFPEDFASTYPHLLDEGHPAVRDVLRMIDINPDNIPMYISAVLFLKRFCPVVFRRTITYEGQEKMRRYISAMHGSVMANDLSKFIQIFPDVTQLPVMDDRDWSDAFEYAQDFWRRSQTEDGRHLLSIVTGVFADMRLVNQEKFLKVMPDREQWNYFKSYINDRYKAKERDIPYFEFIMDLKIIAAKKIVFTELGLELRMAEKQTHREKKTPSRPVRSVI